jgi:hypothetical protein
MSRVYQTIAFSEAEPGLHWFDTIEYAGQFWIVLGWFENQTEKYRIPMRIVRPRLGLQQNADSTQGADRLTRAFAQSCL